MIRLEFKQFQTGLDGIQQSEKRIISMAQELNEKIRQLKAYDDPRLSEQIEKLKQLAETLDGQLWQLRQLIEVLQFSGSQCRQTEEAVVLRCESSCLTVPERRIMTVDLRQTQKNMTDIPFQKR